MTDRHSSAMDLASLRRLARDGLGAFPPDSLPDLTNMCWDQSETTGDARFASLARTFEVINMGWGNQGLPSSVVAQLDLLLASHLEDVLSAPSPLDGAILAKELRRSIEDALLSTK